MENNLHLLRETHLMDRDYFKLIFTLVKASSEICHHKSRRTGLYAVSTVRIHWIMPRASLQALPA